MWTFERDVPCHDKEPVKPGVRVSPFTKCGKADNPLKVKCEDMEFTTFYMEKFEKYKRFYMKNGEKRFYLIGQANKAPKCSRKVITLIYYMTRCQKENYSQRFLFPEHGSN